MAIGRLVTVLHLTDLHFGRYHRFNGDDGLGSLLDSLRQDLDERRDRDGLRPDLVLLSGDFAEHGRKEEFERAYRFIEGLVRLLDLPRRRVVMVPGNHDVNWNKSMAYFAECAAEEINPVPPYFPKLAFYKQLFDRFYEGEADIAFTAAEPWSFFEYSDLGVVVAGLDSAMAESHRDTDHHGFLGEQQLRAFVEKLRPYKERGFLRIGVMHHDPHDRRMPEQDARDLKKILRSSLNLIFHGDVHEERLGWLYGNVPVVGVGSAAVGLEQRAPEIPNEYQFVQIHSAGLRQGLRAWVPDQKTWKGSTRADDAGDTWLVDVPVAFEHVEALGETAAPVPAHDLVEAVERYRRAVARNQGMPTVFDLIGVNETGEAAGGLDFLRVFVPQHVERTALPRQRREELHERGLVSRPIGEIDRELRQGAFEPFYERVPSIDEVLSGPRLLLLGAPGAGKTALTRWLLLQLSIPGEGVTGIDESLVPVRVEMRRFDEEHQRARDTTFFDYLDREHATLFPSLRGESLRALARAGRLYWLFDGLDEVIDEGRRRRYGEMIAALFDEHPDCRGLATSRVAGAEIARGLLERAGFVTYTLQDFADDQRDRFLDAWHALVFARDPDTGRHRRERIARAVSNTPSIRELCRTPLLCALLAYLNREEELPQRRHRLYQKLLERMAEHWDANRHLPRLPGAERFTLDDKLMLLRRLAWHMLAERAEGGNAVDQGALEDFVTRFCEERWEIAPDTARRAAEAMIRQLRERNYVLAFLGGTTYGFAHRTFFEYLAAVHAHEQFRERRWELSDLGKLFADHWEEKAWEEPLLLLCGSLADGEPDHAERVVRVLQAIPGEDRAAVYCALRDYVAFCIKALGELDSLDRGVPGEFARALNDVLERMIRNKPRRIPFLLSAFRRGAGRWPEVERLMAATKLSVKANASQRSRLLMCWIVASGLRGRVRVLPEVFDGPSGYFYDLFTKAASLGAWSSVELDEIHRVIQARTDESEKLVILASIVRTRGMHWEGHESVVQELVALLHGSESEVIRSVSARLLLAAGICRDESKAVLRDTLRSAVVPVVQNALLGLTDTEYDETIVEKLEEQAHVSPSCMRALVQIAKSDARARRALERAVATLRKHADPEMFIQVIQHVALRGTVLVPGEEILTRLSALEDENVRISQLGQMRLVPALCPLVVRALRYEYHLVRDHGGDASRILSEIQRIRADYAGPVLVDLWVELMSVDRADISLPMAGHVLRSASEPSICQRARDILSAHLRAEHPERVRLLAARNLGIRDMSSRQAYLDLARTAQSEARRFTAARMIGDLATLNVLADGARNPTDRAKARNALETYGHIDFLLQVGRPRRARVRFHDRDAGYLEELTAGGPTRFTYSSSYLSYPDARPLAPNLPLRPEPYESDTLHPFFANLLPEGPLYDQTARRLGLKRTDRFGMLLKVGGDVMGAVEVFANGAI